MCNSFSKAPFKDRPEQTVIHGKRAALHGFYRIGAEHMAAGTLAKLPAGCGFQIERLGQPRRQGVRIARGAPASR